MDRKRTCAVLVPATASAMVNSTWWPEEDDLRSYAHLFAWFKQTILYTLSKEARKPL